MKPSRNKSLDPAASGHPPGLDTSLEASLRRYVEDFINNNHAAHVVARGMQVIGIGFWPIIDHVTFRTLNVEERAKEFLAHGYTYDTKLGVIEYENWWAKVYRRPGFPVLFVDQAYEGARGKGSLIPDWVKSFSDKVLHHIAIRVDDIEKAIFYLEKQGIAFAGKIVGDRATDLRQIFTQPEMRQGKAFSVVELTERHHGYDGFLPPQADGLMESTRL